MQIRKVEEKDVDDIRAFLRQYWGSDRMVARGKVNLPAEQPGFLAERDGKIIGLISYDVADDEMKVTMLDSRERNQGVGARLMERVITEGRSRQCRRIWLVATNDNIRALQFFQKQGFDLAALHRNSMEISRKLKPGIPETGYAGIPIRHELEFEYIL